MPNEAWLNYNGFRSIKVDRHRMAKTCSYFSCLLEGPFRESKQHVIKIILGNMFSFEAFDCVISYANDNIFIPDENKVALYMDAIQLAIYWGYEKFIDLVESYFISILSLDWFVDFMALVATDPYYLQKLDTALDKFDSNQARETRRPWPICAINGHQNHCYINCVDKPGSLVADDWEKQVPNEHNVIPEPVRLKIDEKRQKKKNLRG